MHLWFINEIISKKTHRTWNKEIRTLMMRVLWKFFVFFNWRWLEIDRCRENNPIWKISWVWTRETKEKTQINLIAVLTEKKWAEAISIRAQSALKCITCPRLFTIEDQETFRLVFLTRARERVEEKWKIISKKIALNFMRFFCRWNRSICWSHKNKTCSRSLNLVDGYDK